MSEYPPPVLACRLLRSLLPVRHREALLGDLIEEYGLRAESASPGRASRWFWGQACRSILPMAWSSLRSRECLLGAGIALAVYVAMGTINLAADSLIARLTSEGPSYIAAVPVIFLATAALGGYIATRIRTGTSTFLALLVLLDVVVAMRLRLCTVPVPWWYPVPFLTLGPLAVLLAPALLRESPQEVLR